MIRHSLLQLPYQAARAPLAVVDMKFVKRLPADSPPRLVFERLLGSFDVLAGRLLADRGVARRGADLRAHADLLADAVKLEQDAATRRQAAATTVHEARQQASTLREDAQRRESDGVRAALENEREEKQAATARARARAVAAQKQAQERATSRLKTVDHKRAVAETRAGARTQRAAAQAKSALGEAADTKAVAAERRAEASQMAKLTAAKRQARKS